MSKSQINSLTQPRRVNLEFYYHFVKRDILGIKKAHGFETDWAVLRKSLIGESPQRGSAWQSFGELFQLSSCGIWVPTTSHVNYTKTSQLKQFYFIFKSHLAKYYLLNRLSHFH